MRDVQGRTAFITGGGNGIGLGIARSFARAGAKLVLVDVDAAALARAKVELQDITRVETFPLDVRDRDAYAKTAEAAERALGPVSLLFNNAGVAGGAPVSNLTYELWDWVIGINLYCDQRRPNIPAEDGRARSGWSYCEYSLGRGPCGNKLWGSVYDIQVWCGRDVGGAQRRTGVHWYRRQRAVPRSRRDRHCSTIC